MACLSSRTAWPALLWASATALLVSCSGWVTRSERWQPRGEWNWAVSRELPQLFREFNGIDFGHAHLGETLLRTSVPDEVEKGRLEVLDFIFSSPSVPPDEEQIAPTLTRMVWEIQRSFNWAHLLHRSLYDLLADDEVRDKEAVARELVATYLSKPEAITSHPLDLHGKLWSFPESKSFHAKFPKFSTQIWSYHWLQAATYDVQLMGGAERQRELMPGLIEYYHGYLRHPPVRWQSMPMLHEGAPEFSRRFPEAAAIFDNLHMLHDNVDDVLSRPDLYPDASARRAALLGILSIYLHVNHQPEDRFAEYHAPAMAAGMGMEGAQPQGHEGMAMGGMQGQMEAGMSGPRAPSAREVVEGRAPPPSSAAEQGSSERPLEEEHPSTGGHDAHGS